MSAHYRPEPYVRVKKDGPNHFDELLEAWDEEIAERPQPSQAEQAVATVREQFGPRARHVLNLVVFGLACIGAIAGFLVAWMHVVNDPLADTVAYYEAAARLNHGQPLYPPDVDPSSNHAYLYPPLLAVVLRPLALLGYPIFALAWEAVVVGSFVLLLRYLGVRRREVWLALGLLGVPIGWALTVAQAHVPMTYLIAIGQPWSVALAANIKLFPVLIALWWIGRRDWEAIVAFATWMALFAAAQVVLETGGAFAFFSSVGFGQLGEVRNYSPFVLSPQLWAALLVGGVVAVLALARTRWGWAAAVTLATLAPPRLLVYMLTGLLAGLRRPRLPGEPNPDDPDVARVYVRSAR